MGSSTFTKQLQPMNLFGHAVLLIGGFILVYPLIFMILAGFMTKEEYASTVLGLFPIAEDPTLENFKTLIFGTADSQVQLFFFNSLIRTFYNVFMSIVIAMLGGYAFGRLKFKGRDKLFMFLLATIMIPPTVSLIPNFIQFARWPFAGGNDIFTGGKGILDSWWIYLIGGPAMHILPIFLVKQSLQTVPYELDEAAKIDGSSTFRLIFQILMPLQKPMLAFIAITTAQATWNDWATPYFFTSSERLQTLPSAIARLTSLTNNPMELPDYPMMITLGVGITIPMLIIFFIFQKYIVQGLASTGLKG